jgi:hypothetical protein
LGRRGFLSLAGAAVGEAPFVLVPCLGLVTDGFLAPGKLERSQSKACANQVIRFFVVSCVRI